MVAKIIMTRQAGRRSSAVVDSRRLAARAVAVTFFVAALCRQCVLPLSGPVQSALPRSDGAAFSAFTSISLSRLLSTVGAATQTAKDLPNRPHLSRRSAAKRASGVAKGKGDPGKGEATAKRKQAVKEARFLSELQSSAKKGKLSDTSSIIQDMSAAGIRLKIEAYNYVLQACVRAADSKAAEQWLERMAADGVEPNKQSYISAISSCAVQGDMLGAAKQLAAMGKATPEQPGVDVHNSVLKSFVRTADVGLASEWFGQLGVFGITPNVDSYNILLHTCAEAGDTSAAEDWFQSLVISEFSPDQESYVQVVRAHNKAGDASGAARWFNRMLAEGTSAPTKDSFNAIMNSCAKNTNSTSSEQWLERMISAGHTPDRRSYTMVISSWAQQGNPQKAAAWLQQMEAAGAGADLYAYNTVLTAFNYAKDVVGISAQLGRMARSGVVPNEMSYALAMRTFAEIGDSTGALAWFERFELQGLDVRMVPFDKIIQSLSREKNAAGAEEWVSQAKQSGMTINLATYNSVMKSLLDAGRVDDAQQWFSGMGDDYSAQYSTYIMFIKSLARTGDAVRAAEWHGRMVDAGISPSAESFRSVMAAYAEADDKKNVFAWLEKMLSAGCLPDKQTYSTVIKIFARDGDIKSVREWLERMRQSGVEPDIKAFTALVTCCLQQDQHETAAKWLDWMISEELPADVVVFNLVIKGYSKKGDIKGAEKWIKKMKLANLKPNAATYEQLLISYGMKGDFKAAEQCAERSIEAGLQLSHRSKFALAQSYANGPALAILDGDKMSKTNRENATRSLEMWLNRTLGGSKKSAEMAIVEKLKRDILTKAVAVFDFAGDAWKTRRWTKYMSRNKLSAVPKDRWFRPRQEEAVGSGKGKGARRRENEESGMAKRLIDDLMRRNSEPRAADILERLQSSGKAVTGIVYNEVLMALSGHADTAVTVFEDMGEFGLTPDKFTYLALMKMHAADGKSSETVDWFERMIAADIEPDEQHFNVVVPAVLQDASADESSVLDMIQRIIATGGDDRKRRQRTYDFVVRKCLAAGEEPLAAELVEEAEQKKLGLTKATFMVGSKTCLEAEDEARLWWWLGRAWATARNNQTRVSSEMESFVKYVIHGSVSAVGWADEVGAASVSSWFNRLSLSPQWVTRVGLTEDNPPELPYDLLISALAKIEMNSKSSTKRGEASGWLDRAISAGFRPSLKVYKAVLSSCVSQGDSDCAKQWFERIIVSGEKPDAESYASVLKSISKTGDVEAAEEWLARMVEANHTLDLAAYHSGLVNAYIASGDLPNALRLAYEAEEKAGAGAKRPEAVQMWTDLLHAMATTASSDPQWAEDALRAMIRARRRPGAPALLSLRNVLGVDRCKALCEELKIDVDQIEKQSRQQGDKLAERMNRKTRGKR